MRTKFLSSLETELYGGRRPLSWPRLLYVLFIKRDNKSTLILIRLIQHFNSNGREWIARRLAVWLRREFGCFVQPEAQIGTGLRLPHPNGIVIGSGVHIGANCTIYQQVTLGGARAGDWQAGNYPTIGNDVRIFAGAKIVGSVKIGDRACVGANAVVIHDVPADHVAVGIPAQNRPMAVRLAEIDSPATAAAG